MKKPQTLACLAACALAPLASGACDVYVTNIYPVDSNFNPATITLGQHPAWGIMFNATIKGTPTGPLTIYVYCANRYGTIVFPNPTPGTINTGVVFTKMPIDGDVPCSVVVDPNHTTGDTNYGNNTMSTVVNPVPPANAVVYYGPRNMRLDRTLVVSFSGNAVLDRWQTVWGLPKDLGYQTSVSNHQSPNAQVVSSSPFNDDALNYVQTNLLPGTHSVELYTDFVGKNVNVNASLLRTAPWGDEHNPSPDAEPYLQAEPRIQSDAREISQFVANTLPRGYESMMSPYDVARTLYKATIARLSFGPNPSYDAVGAYNSGVADIGGFMALFAATCRNVGIPARPVLALKEGTNVLTGWVDIWIAGYGWIPADPAASEGFDSTGTYAYWFGYYPDMNQQVGVSTAMEHIVNVFPNGVPYDVGYLHTPYAGYWWTNPQNVTNLSTTLTQYLHAH